MLALLDISAYPSDEYSNGYKEIVKQIRRSLKVEKEEAEQIAKNACYDLALAIKLGWKEAEQFASAAQLQQQTHPLDKASIMNLNQKAYGNGKKVLFRARTNPNGEIEEEDYSIDLIKDPSYQDLKVLTEFYGMPPPYDERPPPRYSQS